MRPDGKMGARKKKKPLAAKRKRQGSTRKNDATPGPKSKHARVTKAKSSRSARKKPQATAKMSLKQASAARRARARNALRTTALRPTRPKHGSRDRKGAPAAQRVTPLVDGASAEQLDEFGCPIRPSRIITSRPRPPLRQVDPTGPSADAARTLEPWEVDVDDLAQMIAARAAEESSAVGQRIPISSSTELEVKIESARRVGWTGDPRPSGSNLPDARVRFVHPACKYLDGRLVRDVSLSVHPPSGRASLTLEGGDRARIVSWVIASDDDLPAQVGRILEDPARLARIEFASGRELLAKLDELDRTAIAKLGRVARSGSEGELSDQLLEYVLGFATLNTSYGLPATVDAIWNRFGAREGSVLEKLKLVDDARQRLCDLFDSAIDACQPTEC